MRRRLFTGLYDDERKLVDAVDAFHAAGIEILDVVSPYPIHGIDDKLGIPRSRLTLVCLIGGMIGLSIGIWFQYWSSVTSWPLNVGGKPFDSLPAFIPVGFEMTVLAAGIATACMLLVRNRLRPGRRPRPGFEATTDDTFALIVARGDASLKTEHLREMLARSGASLVRDELEEER